MYNIYICITKHNEYCIRVRGVERFLIEKLIEQRIPKRVYIYNESYVVVVVVVFDIFN